jgi:hypothetical protein
VVLGGEEVVGELPGNVRKLSAEAIGVEEGRRRVFHGGLEAAAVAFVGSGIPAVIGGR